MKKFLPFCFVLQLSIVGVLGASPVFAGTFEAKEAELTAAIKRNDPLETIQRLEYELFYQKLKRDYAQYSNQQLDSIDNDERALIEAKTVIKHPHPADSSHQAELSKIRWAAKISLARFKYSYLGGVDASKIESQSLAEAFFNPYVEDIDFRLKILVALYHRNSRMALQALRQSDLFFWRSSDVTLWRRTHSQGLLAKTLKTIIDEAIHQHLEEKLMNMAADEGQALTKPVHEFAGSFDGRDLYPAEGMIHYPKFIEDISEDSPSYFHFEVFSLFEQNPKTTLINFKDLNRLVALLRNKFSEGKEIVTVVFRGLDSYFTLAIDQYGYAVIVDPYQDGRPNPILENSPEAHALLDALNDVFDLASKVKFLNIGHINAGQRNQISNDTLFIAMLNGRQIAKEGKVHAVYGLRFAPFLDKKSDSALYEYIRAIGTDYERSWSKRPSVELMKALRRKTQDRIIQNELKAKMNLITDDLVQNVQKKQRHAEEILRTEVQIILEETVSKAISFAESVSSAVANSQLRKIAARFSVIRENAQKRVKDLTEKTIIFEGARNIVQTLIDRASLIAEKLKYTECTQEDQPWHLAGALQSCDLSKGSDKASKTDYLGCVDSLMSKFADLKTDQCISSFLPKVNRTLKQNLLQHIEKAQLFSEGQKTSESADLFKHLETWSQKVSPVLFKDEKYLRLSGEREQVEKSIQAGYKEIADAVWNHLQKETHAHTTEYQVPKFSDGLEEFSGLLETVVSYDLDPGIFYSLLDLSLPQIHQRLTFFAQLNDFTAEMLGHELGMSHPSEVSNVIQVLGTLDRPDHSESEGKNLTIENPVIQRWLNAMRAVSKYDKNLLQEVQEEHDIAGNLFSKIPLEWFPAYAQSYVALVKDWTTRASSFKATGLLSAPRLPQLPFGLTEKLIENVLPRSNDRIKQLEEAALSLDNAREAVSRKELQVLDRQTQQRQLETDLEYEKQKLSELHSDLATHQFALRGIQQAHESRLSDWLGLTQQSHWQDSGKTVTVRKGAGRLSGADASYQLGSLKDRIENVAISEKIGLGPFNLKKGQILRISTKGKWAPGCALGKSGISTPVVTGPEGYALVTAKSRSVVTSIEEYEGTKKYLDSNDTSSRSHSFTTLTTDSVLDHYGRERQTSTSEMTQTSHSNQEIHERSNSITNSNGWVYSENYSRSKDKVRDKRETVSTSQSESSGGVTHSAGTSVVRPGSIKSDKKEYAFSDQKSRSEASAIAKSSRQVDDKITTSSQHASNSETYGYSRDHLTSSTSEDVSGTCTQTSEGTMKDEGSQAKNQRLQDSRISASFEMGLRSPFTPFPDLPAGSLLSIHLPKGEINLASAIDVQVVRTDSTIVTNQDVDIYLIINDCQGTDTNQLSVEFSVEELQTGQGQRAAFQAAEDVFEQLRFQSMPYVITGTLSLTAAEELKANVKAQLVSHYGISIEHLDFFRELWESWVNTEIAQIDHRANIVQLERQLLPIVRNIHKIRQDLHGSEKAKEFLETAESWNRARYDLANLGSEVSQTMRFLKDRMLPILKVRYPDVLINLQGKQRQILSSLNLDSSMMDVTRLIRSVHESIKNQVELAADEVNVHEQPVIIRFPRPDLHPDRNIEEKEENEVPYASYLTSLEAWKRLESILSPEKTTEPKPPIRLSIQPEWLYARGDISKGALPRTAVGPIVEGMFLVLQTDNTIEKEEIDELNEFPSLISMDVASDLLFTHETNPEGNRFAVAGAWGKTTIPVIYTNKANPLSTAHDICSRRAGLQYGKGLSPFCSLDVKLGEINFTKRKYVPIAKAIKDMFLLINVRFRNGGARLNWLE